MLVILIEILQGKNVAIWSVFSLIFIKNIDYIWTKNIFKGERKYLARKSSSHLPFSQNGIPCEIFKTKKPGGLLFYTLGKDFMR